MKARRLVSTIVVAAAAIAMSLNAQANAPAQANHTTIQQEVKATPREEKVVKKTVQSNVGGSGLDLHTHFPDYGLSPKEYGMRYGNGKSRKGKTNKLHVKHSYKVKRRAA